MNDTLLLTALWLVPAIGMIAVLLVPRSLSSWIKWISLGTTVGVLLVALLVLEIYLQSPRAQAPLRDRTVQNLLLASGGDGYVDSQETAQGVLDLVTRQPWIPGFGIQYYMGLDGVNLSLVLLAALISVLACLASWKIEKQVKGYYSLYLMLTACMMGVFLALDLILFYVFLELMLLPMYFLIALWGGPDREYAAIKFLLYTLFGSVFVLVAILILYFYPGTGARAFHGRSLDMIELAAVATESSYYPRWLQGWVFVLFLVGFLVKLPSIPFHTWLPDAHVEAPTPISMILAGVLLKIGGYGLVRLAWPLAPAGAYDWSLVVAILGVISILYGALAAMGQTDFKKLVAYSSVSHMGYVTLGMASMALFSQADSSQLDPRSYAYGVNGAMFMMLGHGITSAGMFFLVGVISDRVQTRQLDQLGGLNSIMPLYGALSYVIFFGAMGLPGLCGFVGEVFVVLAAFHYSIPLGALSASAVVLTAGYILWTLERVFLGRNESWEGLKDLDRREILIAAPLVTLTIALGIFPQALVLNWMSPSVDQTVQGIVTARELNAQPGQMGSQARQPAIQADLAKGSESSNTRP